MSPFLIHNLARYIAAYAMERRARSYIDNSNVPASTNIVSGLSEADICSWNTDMRWLIPFVQATGCCIVIENPKSHEQIVIDQNTKNLPALTVEWMQRYDKLELLEWIVKDKERQIAREEKKQKKLQIQHLAKIHGRERFGNHFTLDDTDNQSDTDNQ